MTKEKDPRRQLMGKISKAKGKHFEERLDADVYKRQADHFLAPFAR